MTRPIAVPPVTLRAQPYVRAFDASSEFEASREAAVRGGLHTTSELLRRGWTRTQISRLLAMADSRRVNEHHRARPVNGYDRDRVHSLERRALRQLAAATR